MRRCVFAAMLCVLRNTGIAFAKLSTLRLRIGLRKCRRCVLECWRAGARRYLTLSGKQKFWHRKFDTLAGCIYIAVATAFFVLFFNALDVEDYRRRVHNLFLYYLYNKYTKHRTGLVTQNHNMGRCAGLEYSEVQKHSRENSHPEGENTRSSTVKVECTRGVDTHP